MFRWTELISFDVQSIYECGLSPHFFCVSHKNFIFFVRTSGHFSWSSLWQFSFTLYHEWNLFHCAFQMAFLSRYVGHCSCLLILLLNFVIVYVSFSIDSFGSSQCIIILSINSYLFCYCFFSNYSASKYFLISLFSQTYSIGGCGHLCLGSDFNEKVFLVWMSAAFLKCLFCIFGDYHMIFILSSMNMID